MQREGARDRAFEGARPWRSTYPPRADLFRADVSQQSVKVAALITTRVKDNNDLNSAMLLFFNLTSPALHSRQPSAEARSEVANPVF